MSHTTSEIETDKEVQRHLKKLEIYEYKFIAPNSHQFYSIYNSRGVSQYSFLPVMNVHTISLLYEVQLYMGLENI